MPLYDGALEQIRSNLQSIQRGKKAPLVAIGTLTDTQLKNINEDREHAGYPPIQAEIVFLGQHVFDSRVVGDGYSIEDVVDQIVSGLASSSVVLRKPGMTTMQNQNERPDRYGNKVRDKVVLECSARHPRPELFSVIPKGDRNKPNKKAACLSEAALILSDSPG
jgi:hypothetical protein